MQWYNTLCRLQAEAIKAPGEPAHIEMKGVLGCYYGLAYSLYLLDHNVELQSRLLARLKNRSNSKEPIMSWSSRGPSSTRVMN